MAPDVPSETFCVHKGPSKSARFGHTFDDQPIFIVQLVKSPCSTQTRWTSAGNQNVCMRQLAKPKKCEVKTNRPCAVASRMSSRAEGFGPRPSSQSVGFENVDFFIALAVPHVQVNECDRITIS